MRWNHHNGPRNAMLMLLAWAVSVSPVLARTANDPYLADQWHLEKINAPKAWDTTLGFEGVAIAIIDSGVDLDHPDLKDNIWRNVREIAGNGIDDDGNGYVDDIHGWDFVGNDNNPTPDVSGSYTIVGANHGTADAGVAAARGDNGIGISGVSWQASIMPLRVLDSRGSGRPSDVVRAVEYAVHNGARIINMSFAGTARSPELFIALRRAYEAGVLVVAAAGNAPDGDIAADLDARPLYPVCFDTGDSANFILGVAASSQNDRRAPFSNFGADCVDISAPGIRMISTQLHIPGHRDFSQPYGGYYDGTSVAAAEVSGAAALLFALDRNLTPTQVMDALMDAAARVETVPSGGRPRLGKGRLDVAAAVDLVLSRRVVAPAETVMSTASLLPPGTGSRLVLAAPASGRRAEVRMFTPDGSYVRSFMAYPAGFNGGVSLAAGVFGATGGKSIVTGAGAGGSPQVRIFDMDTRVIGGFYAYDTRFLGGVRVATGDVDGDGIDEIITGAGTGGGPHVRIFRPNGVPIGGFFAASPATRTGVYVDVADLNGDGIDEILTRTASGAEPVAWNANGTKFVPPSGSAHGPAAPAGHRATGAPAGMRPFVSILNAAGTPVFGFQAFESSFKGGVNAVIIE